MVPRSRVKRRSVLYEVLFYFDSHDVLEDGL